MSPAVRPKAAQMRSYESVPGIFAAFVVFSALSIAVPPPSRIRDAVGTPPTKVEKAEKHENKAERKADKKHGPAKVVVVDRDGHVRVIHEYAPRGIAAAGAREA